MAYIKQTGENIWVNGTHVDDGDVGTLSSHPSVVDYPLIYEIVLGSPLPEWEIISYSDVFSSPITADDILIEGFDPYKRLQEVVDEGLIGGGGGLSLQEILIITSLRI